MYIYIGITLVPKYGGINVGQGLDFLKNNRERGTVYGNIMGAEEGLRAVAQVLLCFNFSLFCFLHAFTYTMLFFRGVMNCGTRVFFFFERKGARARVYVRACVQAGCTL
jgi:hypothetical protein